MTKTKNNLQEISADDLKRTGDTVQINHVENPGLGIENSKVQWAYEAGTKRFLIWGLYDGVEDTYPFKIDFLKVQAEEITDPEEINQIAQSEISINVPYIQDDGRLLFVTNYGKAFFITPPSISSSDVQVRCGCPSYRFSYFKGNKNKKAATGANFPVYIPNGRGKPKPVIEGLCKHLQLIIDSLLEAGIIQ
jgi:hypothetical protein